MPRKNYSKTVPKSKKSIDIPSSKNIRSFLGDESGSSSEDESFRSVDFDENQTDYGLDLTTSSAGAGLKRIYNRGRDKESAASTSLGVNKTGNTTSPQRRRKQKTPKNKAEMFLRSVRQLQMRTDNLIPKASFARVVREILTEESSYADRLTLTALQALQESAEMYLTSLFEDAYCCTLHRGRVTLAVKDIELTKYLRGRSDPGNR